MHDLSSYYCWRVVDKGELRKLPHLDSHHPRDLQRKNGGRAEDLHPSLPAQVYLSPSLKGPPHQQTMWRNPKADF